MFAGFFFRLAGIYMAAFFVSSSFADSGASAYNNYLGSSAPVYAQNTTPPGYVFGVTVSSARELDVILDRADRLRDLFNPEQHSRIAIVLHGEELQLFQKGSRSANQSIIERARLLDEGQIIDIKACQTRMRDLNIQQSELPNFIEQVPYAPAEIERLKSEQGFTSL